MDGKRILWAVVACTAVLLSGCAITRSTLMVSTQVKGVDVSYVLSGTLVEKQHDD